MIEWKAHGHDSSIHTANVGGVEITTCVHIDTKPNYVVICRDVNIDYIDLGTDNLSKAKKEALKRVEFAMGKKIARFKSALEKIDIELQ